MSVAETGYPFKPSSSFSRVLGKIVLPNFWWCKVWLWPRKHEQTNINPFQTWHWKTSLLGSSILWAFMKIGVKCPWDPRVEAEWITNRRSHDFSIHLKREPHRSRPSLLNLRVMINFYGSLVFCVLSITTAGPDYHIRKLRPIRLDNLLQITVSRFIRARHTVILPLGCKTNRQ